MAKSMIAQAFAETGELMDLTIRSLKRNSMPYDAECEYITIPAESYIDTGISPEDKGFGMRWELPDTSNMVNNSFINGAIGNTSTQSNSYYQIYWNPVRPLIYSIFVPTSRKDYSVSNLSGIHYANFVRGTTSDTSPFFINGTSYAFNAQLYGYSNIPTFCLGGRKYLNNNIEEVDIATKPVRIYSFYFNQYGEPTNYYIPVRKNSEGFLYDLFTKQMLGSATDTPLIPGPDKA